MKKSKIAKLHHNLDLDQLFLEKILCAPLDFYLRERRQNRFGVSHVSFTRSKHPII